jgi:uncharacterized BrkB/YihY/UPF0761 family membrane protein
VKVFLILSIIGFIVLILGSLGLIIPMTEYKQISDLSEQWWAKPLIANPGPLITFGFVFFIGFGLLYASAKILSKKK